MYTAACDAFRLALDLVLPRACALCGSSLPPGAPYPLCDACYCRLPRLTPLPRLPASPGPRASEGALAGAARCGRCGKALISERDLCLRCRTSDYRFDSAYPLYPYRGLAKELIIAYKLRNRRSLAAFLAKELWAAATERFPGSVIVPVPPRPGKLRRKGWDQVEAIARIMERRHGARVRRILARRVGAQEQKKLGFEARAANMRGRVRVRAQGGLDAQEHYLLIDDVFTTGATLSACAHALKAAGAARVDALVLAAD